MPDWRRAKQDALGAVMRFADGELGRHLRARAVVLPEPAPTRDAEVAPHQRCAGCAADLG